MKIVHAADLHVDSPLRGLERYEGAPVEAIRGATRRALENLVGLCLEEEAALLLIAGDLFDGAWKDYATGLFFARQMARLREGGTRVVLARGNHDAASEVTKHLRHPEHVHELGSRRPETVRFDDLGVSVHGQSYASRAVDVDLAARYPEAQHDGLDIGVLHTALDGREGHDPYAPTSVDVLRAKRYHYWALGHVHARELVCQRPWIVFPGNLQGRHAKETGAKGATLVHAESERVVAVEHRALDAVRWERVAVAAGGATSRADVLERAGKALRAVAEEAGGRVCCVRIVLAGATSAHGALARHRESLEHELRALAIDASEALWVERVVVETAPELDRAAIAERDDALGELARGIAAARGDEELLRVIADELAEVRRKLPLEAREGDDPVDLESPGALRALLDEVEQSLVPRLSSAEDDA